MEKNKIKKIILIIADTLRAKNVGLYGERPSPTPNIDRLGKSGAVFNNAYASITYTDPSITAIMTGKYPLSSGVVNHGRYLQEEEQENLRNARFLPEILMANGYKTAAVDWLERWHRKGYNYYSGKIIKDFDSKHLIIDDLPPFFYLRKLDKLAIKFFKRDFFLRFYYSFFSQPKIPYDPADVVVNKAIDILEKNRKERVFLYLHFWDAHFPHTKTRGLKPYLFSGIEQTYNAEIKFLDQEIGRLLTYLGKNSQLDDTFIIFTSDHGENFYEHGVPLNHECLYEDVVRVPLIFWYKDFLPRKINALVQHVDILPTILDLLKIPHPSRIDGQSLLPIIFGGERQVRNFVYFEDIVYRRIQIMKSVRRRGIRVGRYKYIETLEGEKENLYQILPSGNLRISQKELYDLKKDPEEKENLIEKRAQVGQKFERKLKGVISSLSNKRPKTPWKRGGERGKITGKGRGKEKAIERLRSLGYW